MSDIALVGVRLEGAPPSLAHTHARTQRNTEGGAGGHRSRCTKVARRLLDSVKQNKVRPRLKPPARAAGVLESRPRVNQEMSDGDPAPDEALRPQ